MKVAAKIYKGIEYVLFNQLPEEQREKFAHTANDSLFIKIMIDGKVVSGCVQYKDYEQWYDLIYQGQVGASPARNIATHAYDVVETTVGK